MSFTTTDQADLVKLLNLSRDQYEPNSVLAQCMTALELFDTRISTNLVGEVQEAMLTISTLDGQIEAQSANVGIKSIDIVDDVAIEYGSGGSVTTNLQNKRAAQIAEIRRLLDPDQVLEAYSLSGRVIATL